VLPGVSTLLEALQLLVPGASNRTLRQMLEQGRVCINGIPCRLAKQRIQPDDTVEIGDFTARRNLGHGIKVVFEDKDLLVIEKPSGLLTIATASEKDRTAYALLREYVKLHHPKKKLFIVHRLDKFASGLLVFAKEEKVKSKLQALFKRHDVRRKYWAIVEGHVAQNQGTIRSRLAEDQTLRMHSTDDSTAGKLAITHYQVLQRLPTSTSLEVTLETGRKNQIRAHLSELGHPILGDRAYGSTRDPMGRLGLHAFQLGFIHPTRAIPLLFETEMPAEFRRFLPKAEG
jgi:23S rRNA pseudouridine1911/1915/1917 synthase